MREHLSLLTIISQTKILDIISCMLMERLTVYVL